VIRVADHYGDLRGVDREGRDAFLIQLNDSSQDTDADLPVGSTPEQIAAVANRAVNWLIGK
jgi:hypothetical protein